MGEIKVTNNEVKYLKNKLKLKIDFDTGEIKWNSNPNNYEILSNTILSKYKDDERLSQEFSVPRTFLRDFFYYQEDLKKVRLKSIDKLYQFLFDKTRSEYLTDEGIYFDTKKHFLFISSIYTEKKLKKIDFKISSDTMDLERFTLSESNTSTIISKAEDESVATHLFIDERFLKDLMGARLLIDLFCRKFILLILDYNIQFHFDENLFDEKEKYNLVTFDGKYSFVEYWQNKKDKLSIGLDADTLEKITGREFFMIIKNLVKFKVREDILNVETERVHAKMKIGTFLPILSETNNIPPKDKELVYKNHTNTKDYNFFCVVGYESYLKSREKAEMLKYFNNFSRYLEDSNKIRIFTVPAIRDKKKWTSQLSLSANKLLYQYLYINIISGVETFCLFYDKNDDSYGKHILWHQDYVIKSRNKKELTSTDLIESLKNIDSANITEELEEQELHLSYPEKVDNVNQCIQIDNKLYLIRILKDFVNRMRVDKLNLNAHLMQCTKSKTNLKVLRKKLDIELEDSVIEQLENEVNFFYKPEHGYLL